MRHGWNRNSSSDQARDGVADIGAGRRDRTQESGSRLGHDRLLRPKVLRINTAAMKPVPKPGILDIEAYVGGRAQAAGAAEPIKLSSNESPLGPSPAVVWKP